MPTPSSAASPAQVSQFDFNVAQFGKPFISISGLIGAGKVSTPPPTVAIDLGTTHLLCGAARLSEGTRE